MDETGRPEPERSFLRSTAAQTRLHELVPGGAHTYARGSDQYPEGMAPIIVRGEGARVLDLDGNWFVEYGMGLRAVTLGHAYQPVVEAVARGAASGSGFSRPSVWELEAAERFIQMVPGAEMVKFAKNGSDVTTAAVKLARAATGRDLVAVCSSQPFFSIDDWFIGTTAMNAGIPEATRALTVAFEYNNLQSLALLLAQYPNRIAAVIMEPATGTLEPDPGFLEGVRDLADKDGFVLIFDEIICGMRWSSAGAQSVYGVTPDLSTWGKALGNGFSVSALAGKRSLMELGGLNTDASRVFLLSNTHGAEVTGLAAYLSVADAYSERDVVGIMETQGSKLRSALLQVISEEGMSDYITISGRPSALLFATRDKNGRPSQEYRTLFIQELLRNGVLAQSLVISAAHSDDDIDITVVAVAAAAKTYARAIERGTTEGLLAGRSVAPALREFAAPRRLEGPK
ncbi:glutamate-1-semialdehyde 2,1-aminomutase [Planctomonas sp. JC2975]|uniref:glutamate-1-semialdehyde 2,1-aminomutase n=1 Tax=Planctomonas sp. JC2975 TaxID=2729626 RepID=UPI0014728F50|nr:glutamate-1-semialdehyde 2,1-aminomutase [Planctomonas sp. JC2975]NNC11885.1 glutamate-1-semialdehyde 2,1-aminomutase [Planctomonas sp. JC2975]